MKTVSPPDMLPLNLPGMESMPVTGLAILFAIVAAAVISAAIYR